MGQSDPAAAGRPAPAGAIAARAPRRRRAVLLASLSVLGLLLLAAGAAVGFSDARRARRQAASVAAERDAAVAQMHLARERAEAAGAVNEFLNQNVLGRAGDRDRADPGALPERDLKVRDALDRAAARIADRYGAHPRSEFAVRDAAARAYFDLGDYAKAQEHLEAALRAALQAPAGQRPPTHPLQNVLGMALVAQGEFDRAEECFRQSLAGYGAQDAAALAVRSNLSILYLSRGKPALAEPLLVANLDASRRLLGERDPQTLKVMNNLATLYEDRGQYARAEPLFRHVLDACRASFGDRHPHTLLALHNLAALCEDQGSDPGEARRDPAAAAARLREALALWQEAEGEDSKEVARVVLELARALQSLPGAGAPERGEAGGEKRGEVEPLLRRAVALRRKAFGPRDPAALEAVRALADHLTAAGTFAAAEPLWLELWDRAGAGGGGPRSDAAARKILPQLAAFYRRWGKPAEAAEWAAKWAELQRQAMENLQASIAAASRDVAAVDPTRAPATTRADGGVPAGGAGKADLPALLTSRGKLYARAGRFREAAADFARAIDLDPAGHWAWYYQGCLLAYLGDEPAYRAHCRAMLAASEIPTSAPTPGPAPDPGVARRTANVVLLRADSGPDRARVAALVGRGKPAAGDVTGALWHQMTRALAACRAGDDAACLEALEKDAAPSRPDRAAVGDLLRAMAHHRLGHPEPARAALTRAARQIDQDLPRPGEGDLQERGWNVENWLICQTLRREAEAMIGAPGPRE